MKGSTGAPVVILTGMGCSFYEWHSVSESLCKTNRVLMYHRPGLGRSQLQDDNRNTRKAVQELFNLIECLDFKEPIILVGHSYGGLCAQHFLKKYPYLVGGLILVDSTSVDLHELDELDLPLLNKDSTDEIWIQKCMEYSTMSEDEIFHELQPSLTEKEKQLPTEIQRNILTFSLNPLLYKAMASEIRNWKYDAEHIKHLHNPKNTPLIVIGRDKQFNIQTGINDGSPKSELELFENTWHQLIIDQLSLSCHSELIIAENASHNVHLDRPDVIEKAVGKVVSQLY
ncbi:MULTISPECIES: alpha/beta hydrolase [Oceanobacillus]|uniref:alpha/beta hydrolase n=1 Tax=Oceanobacillus TaxID=182709 RepID=UPI00034771BC|nr:MULTISPECIES: alpha/beta hydrolase [Oceanobacillus]MCT1577734.1 alpha/beta hydrolase [Oceanobacillus kimchii]MCT2136722.1 alpha/beta hydrolase [Oceanobacillus kimchii]OEH53856.1 alpha/beta hydrolase [Oceanobacillus sp. E9]